MVPRINCLLNLKAIDALSEIQQKAKQPIVHAIQMSKKLRMSNSLKYQYQFYVVKACHRLFENLEGTEKLNWIFSEESILLFHFFWIVVNGCF